MNEPNETNGNTLKYRVDQLEACVKAGKLSIDNLSFILEYSEQIRDLKIMKDYIDRKEESDKWFRRLLIATLIGSIAVPIIMKYIG